MLGVSPQELPELVNSKTIKSCNAVADNVTVFVFTDGTCLTIEPEGSIWLCNSYFNSIAEMNKSWGSAMAIA